MGVGTVRRALSACAIVGSLVAFGGSAPAGAAPANTVPSNTVPLRVIAFGDLHGNLLPPEGLHGEVVRSDGVSVPAGGAAYLAAYVRQLREQADNSVLYAVGDTWGSSPLESGLFHDEPTIALLGELDLTAAALGNHELDRGYAEFERLRDGGCHPKEGCRYAEPFEGANFPILGANLTTTDGTPAALPYSIDYVDGVPVGVIGVVPSNTPDMIRPDAIAGLRFEDEITSVNRTADILGALGVRSIVVLYKGDIGAIEGDDPCPSRDGGAAAIATSVSADVDLIITSDGDRHFNCTYTDPAGRPRTVVQGASHGRILSVADLAIDRQSREVRRDSTVVFTQVVTHDIAPDPATLEFVDRAVETSAEVANRPIARVDADITRRETPSGESALGNLVADAQLAATRHLGAQIALMNPGGLRSDLLAGDGTVSYRETYAVQPFGNMLQVLDLTGAQLDALLEQQFQKSAVGSDIERILAPSHNLNYTLDRLAPRGERIRSITIDGEPVDPERVYKVVVNNFLAGGGDGFTVCTEAHGLVGAGKSLDALNSYLATRSRVEPPAVDRIRLH
ncbi:MULTISPECIES: 5'-nucleotidase C-terminal domain-containing protein [Rhodococcus]|uniref:bifunctional metallophosphatase/5'-nucleotidase n=1 Tax=Rhodococcus TaxID=1827 RepID=UPI0010219ECE|nr:MULTISPECIES: 5'-nucleotidase C-terminal domain-containing protein [Rhodococcus]UTT48868.1 5'-nucleotidase C-terminal domain-containing protein [Rhodococcus gordoniae]